MAHVQLLHHNEKPQVEVFHHPKKLQLIAGEKVMSIFKANRTLIEGPVHYPASSPAPSCPSPQAAAAATLELQRPGSSGKRVIRRSFLRRQRLNGTSVDPRDWSRVFHPPRSEVLLSPRTLGKL